MQEPTSAAPPTERGRRDLIGYVGPMLTYLVLSQAEALIPAGREATWYPIAYAAKAAATLVVLLVGRSVLRDLRKPPTPIGWAASVGLGLLVTAAWVGLDGVYPPLPFIGGRREAFDPTVLGPPAFWAFVAVRMAGLVLLVPVFEELFWRSFLMRTVIDPEIEPRADRPGHADGGGDHLGRLHARPPGMAAGAADRPGLGRAPPVDREPLGLRRQPRDGEPGAGDLRNGFRTLGVLVRWPSGPPPARSALPPDACNRHNEDDGSAAAPRQTASR